MTTVSASTRRVALPPYLAILRPEHWIKNVLVAAAPLAAGMLGREHVAIATAQAFVAFCLAASAVYCVNDVCDVERDRHHPRKRLRAVASGAVPVRTALIIAVVCTGASIALCSTNSLRLVIGIYLVLNIAYSLGLKNEPVVELCIVASGFLLRAVGGGPANHIPLSRWFLLVAGFGSLVLVAGKRLSELVQLDGKEPVTRPMLARYHASYLRMVLGIAAAVTMSAYVLWAFDVGAHRTGFPWATLSIVPLVVALLRYLLDADAGRAEAPERFLVTDRTLQFLGVAWFAIFLLAVRG
ncbi:decaprenyl-phosphate phosphoribosyltransferase [uncultured Jatrophihabitans sp.]|uniref:decaprenyl-phosphate phosphoribosyltransferase n=1 Tax=uncultured Jatrophihabitans sp. TaxID=1610747 RepID=UPI0035CBED07